MEIDEIRRKVIERALRKDESRKDEEALIQSLVETTDLSREEIRKIVQEVKEEQHIRTQKKTRIKCQINTIILLVSILLASLIFSRMFGSGFFFLGLILFWPGYLWLNQSKDSSEDESLD